MRINATLITIKKVNDPTCFVFGMEGEQLVTHELSKEMYIVHREYNEYFFKKYDIETDDFYILESQCEAKELAHLQAGESSAVPDSHPELTINYSFDDKKLDKSFQVDGDHYCKYKIQPWDIIDEYGLNFYEGNVLKYLLRKKDNRKTDLEKAIHYLKKELSNYE